MTATTTTILAAAGNSQVTIHPFGAHVTSWKNAKGEEMLYTSPLATFNGPKAIRGGIPICFPQFGTKGNLRQHGLARISTWTLVEATNTCAKWVWEDDEKTRAEWPHKFRTTVTITLSEDGNTLTVDLDFESKNVEDPIPITCAFHTYFACDALSAKITDLEGVANIPVVDLLSDYEPKAQEGPITFHPGKMEHIYFSTPNKVRIPTLTLEKSSSLPDLVVWNPTQSQTMGDLPEDGYKHFICVEAGRIKDEAVVLPGSSWSCSHKMTSH